MIIQQDALAFLRFSLLIYKMRLVALGHHGDSVWQGMFKPTAQGLANGQCSQRLPVTLVTVSLGPRVRPRRDTVHFSPLSGVAKLQVSETCFFPFTHLLIFYSWHVRYLVDSPQGILLVLSGLWFMHFRFIEKPHFWSQCFFGFYPSLNYMIHLEKSICCDCICLTFM